MGAFVSATSDYNDPSFSGAYAITGASHAAAVEGCKDTCSAVSANLGSLDGVRIPGRLLEKAKGVAVLTVAKGGLGFAGFEFGPGLVVARLPDDRGWSPPSAIGSAGVSWGALVGAQISDLVFLLMTDKAVDVMSTDNQSFQLGADIAVAVGPLGRSVEADLGASSGHADSGGGVALAPIYAYSLSKGLYAGASLDGKVMVTRHRVNEKFYGYNVRARDLLNGEVPTPPAAQPLYDALKRCHVYASTAERHRGGVDNCVGSMGRGPDDNGTAVRAGELTETVPGFPSSFDDGGDGMHWPNNGGGGAFGGSSDL